MGYFDNAATTPLMPEVKDYVISLLDTFGNPSSTNYSLGQTSRDIVDDARQSVANFIGADEDEITFTSSGSAANTLGIVGWEKNRSVRYIFGNPILYSSICHKSIRLCAEEYHGKPIPVDSKGMIEESSLKSMLDYVLSYATKPLVVLSMADSEIGTIQDSRHLIELCHERGAIVLLDATGYISSYEVNVKDLDCDMLTFSGHKLGAMKGVGVLYKKKDVNLSPLVYGSQENGLFGGTENIIGIASLGKACSLYGDKYAGVNGALNWYLWKNISNKIPKVTLIGNDLDKRLPHNLYVSIDGINGEDLIILMDEHGYQISAGSACNTGSLEASPTLKAIGLSDEESATCIRITISGLETKEELDNFCSALASCVESLRWVSKNE